jgi:hypothetical protein
MAQFILDQSELDTDSLGPITFAIATANLGGITASASNIVINTVTATANLGGMLATAVIPSSNLTSNSGGPAYIQPTVYVPEIIQKPVIVIKTNFGVAYTNLLSMKANASSRIDFSIMEDDSEVLLLI